MNPTNPSTTTWQPPELTQETPAGSGRRLGQETLTQQEDSTGSFLETSVSVSQKRDHDDYTDRKGKFDAFHKANPHIYTLIVDRCKELRRNGVNHYSIECIINRIRWDYDIGVHADKSGFNFNNNYKSFYARKIMWDHPDLDGFFTTRERRHETKNNA